MHFVLWCIITVMVQQHLLEGNGGATMKKRLPVGIENFEKIRREQYYYVDKTNIIIDLLHMGGEVNLFTRPRRFGKSLTMSMLKNFFQIGANPQLFEGLAIAEDKELCREYLGQYPVVSIGFKDVARLTLEDAKISLKSQFYDEAKNHYELMDSQKLDKNDRDAYKALLIRDEKDIAMTDNVMINALYRLTELLHKHYGKPAVLLIDEYDVPLDYAYRNGYYDAMVDIMRNIFHKVLKTNEHLYMAVLTGCMRVSKESVFTGLNNPKVFTITDVRSGEYFGFTDSEVCELLAYYGLSEQYDKVRAWYDGYRFGSVHEIYCPWDVLNYCDLCRFDASVEPESYWANSSGNYIVHDLISHAGNAEIKHEVERLINGERIEKKIRQELTYQDMDKIENIWSVLFMTGYLTSEGATEDGRLKLRIPNLEIRSIFVEQIEGWFKEVVKRDGELLGQFCQALQAGNAQRVEELFTRYLKKHITIRDTAVANRYKENFYHGILIGILGFKTEWYCRSNQQTGDGYSDIFIEDEEEELGIIIEVKYPDSGDLEKGAKDALMQIEKKHYDEKMFEDDVKKVLKYGIACGRRKCRVMVKE